MPLLRNFFRLWTAVSSGNSTAISGSDWLEYIWVWVNTYRYHDFSGLFTSINPSYDLGWTKGTRVLTQACRGFCWFCWFSSRRWWSGATKQRGYPLLLLSLFCARAVEALTLGLISWFQRPWFRNIWLAKNAYLGWTPTAALVPRHPKKAVEMDWKRPKGHVQSPGLWSPGLSTTFISGMILQVGELSQDILISGG